MTSLEVDLQAARRAAIVAQRLSAERPAASIDGLLDTARALHCIQLDPTNVVARSQLLVLWSRLGPFDAGLLDQLMWGQRSLFHYWAHAASLVLTEDYPIHRWRMRSWSRGDGAWGRRVRQWMKDNNALERHILGKLRAGGPSPTRDFEDVAKVGWESSGWTRGRNVGRMLDFLWAQGKIMVAGRTGNQRIWDLTERWLPEWTPRETLTRQQMVERAAMISLRCLGVATDRHIQEHFVRGGYPGLATVMSRLERRGEVVPVTVTGEGRALPGAWYVHGADATLVEGLARGDGWRPRTSLLSPFDNLICDRARTEAMFGFHYRIEIYVPRDKRRFGYFAMPVLHGDRLIARIDPALDRKRAALVIKAVHAEPDAPMNRSTGTAVAEAIEDLAAFLGAETIEYPAAPPRAWQTALR